MLSSRQLAVAVLVSSLAFACAALMAPAGVLLLLVVMTPGLILATQASVATVAGWTALTGGGIAMIFNVEAAATFALLFGVPVLAMSIGVRRLWSVERTVLAGLGVWCVGIATVIGVSFGGLAPLSAIAGEQLTRAVDAALNAYRSIGAAEETVAMLEAERTAVVNGIVHILPAIIVLIGGATILLNLLFVRSWTGLGAQQNLRVWRTPELLIWALIASGFSMFAPLPLLSLPARNVFVLLLGCYFCQGLAIVSYYLDRFRLPRGVRIAGYVLISVQHIVAVMVLALGIFDLWGNFRRLGGSANLQLHPDK